ncbi:MAG: hypothetical protein J2P17_23360, partial [Mycobacterium sp.]|nr:hypothetical protein [Mycobacterium sp.]
MVGSGAGRAEKDQLTRLIPRRSAEPTRTLLDEWAYTQLYLTEADRRAALPTWLHHYNHHRH